VIAFSASSPDSMVVGPSVMASAALIMAALPLVHAF
jgi:hypothetical protein